MSDKIKKLMEDIGKPKKYVSKCCGAGYYYKSEYYAQKDDVVTNFYVCKKCGETCDTVEKKKPVKLTG